MHLLPDGTYHLACGSTEMGNGITTAHKQIAASILGTRADDINIINADTDRTPYMTLAPLRARALSSEAAAVHLAAQAMSDDIIGFASRYARTAADQCRLDNDAVICAENRRHPAA